MTAREIERSDDYGNAYGASQAASSILLCLARQSKVTGQNNHFVYRVNVIARQQFTDEPTRTAWLNSRHSFTRTILLERRYVLTFLLPPSDC